jgi:hypothetical protein
MPRKDGPRLVPSGEGVEAGQSLRGEVKQRSRPQRLVMLGDHGLMTNARIEAAPRRPYTQSRP